MKITIELDPGELAAAFAQLAGALVQPKQPPPLTRKDLSEIEEFWNTIQPPPSPTIAQLDPANNLEFVQKTRPPRALRRPLQPAPVEPPFTRNGFTYTPVEPEVSTTLAPEPEAASSTIAPEPPKPAPKPAAQQRLAASKVGADLATKRRANGAGMEFEEFDALVKREVRRLAAGKTMPSHALWNEMRDPKLPTLSTVITRYGATSAEDLASLLGYNPPLWGIKPQQPADEETQAAEAVSA